MVNQPLSNQELLAECDRQLQALKETVQKAYERGLVDVSCTTKIQKTEISVVQVIKIPASGALIPSTRSEINENGEQVFFPTCDGERGNPWQNKENFYWSYQWWQKGRKKTVYVARRKIEVVKEAIALKKTPEEIVRLIKYFNSNPIRD